MEFPRAVRSLSYVNEKCSGVENGGKRNMEGENIYVSFSRVFGMIEFLFIKINQNYWFAGNESGDNVKDHEVIVVDKLVQKDSYHFEYSTVASSVKKKPRVNVFCILTF